MWAWYSKIARATFKYQTYIKISFASRWESNPFCLSVCSSCIWSPAMPEDLKSESFLFLLRCGNKNNAAKTAQADWKTNKHSKNTGLITLVKVILVSRSKNCSQDRALQIRACRFEPKFSPCKIYSATGVTNSWLGHRLMNEDPTFLLRFTCIFTLSRGAQIPKRQTLIRLFTNLQLSLFNLDMSRNVGPIEWSQLLLVDIVDRRRMTARPEAGLAQNGRHQIWGPCLW